MTFAPHLRFRAAAQLLLAIAVVASPHARAEVGNPFARPWHVVHTLTVSSAHLTPRTCEVDQTSPRPNAPLEPRLSPFERVRPVILDGVMYLETGPRSNAVGVYKAAVSQCPDQSKMWTLGVIPRRIALPRYY